MIEIDIECDVSHNYPGDPKYLIVGSERYGVRLVNSRWRDPEKYFFEIELEDGKILVVYYDYKFDSWFLRI